ncbi:HAD superfamily hydrolase (TIGR01509 family) [Deinobacterium chartae]|uniref:HAD superfamily hydrolase (TIGR01509 family) n=1 Tax=Deinobacterium chartae TaxID=521158 RepID=A0A841HUC8_9DEIO|nr:HAD family hydrolase [Deinobacterium chartae]MBB6096957.1 HAD superfamily hydrolase (TIGR01509 family) [Deinobacterium chartae]
MTAHGIILDMDGTLIDSNDAHARAWQRAFAEHHLEVPFDRIRPLIGMGSDQLLPRLAGIEKESLQGQALSEAWTRYFQEELPSLRPLDGARSLLEALRARGMRLVLASSGDPKLLDRLIGLVNIRDLLDGSTSSGDGASKPAPDTLQAALNQLGLPPEQVVMLGDTPHDLEAARRAGVRMIALRSGGFSDADLAGAAEIWNDPQDLGEHLEESLLGQSV